MSLSTVVYAQAQSAKGQVSFKRDVRPILSNHCFACHGPDESHREASMRLDMPGQFDVSEILARITSTDPDVVMPPPKLNKPLKPAQLETLTRWLAAGAPYTQHWAFIAPQAPAIPSPIPPQTETTPALAASSDDRRWGQQPIDRFVLSNLLEAGLHPTAQADKRTLIRRLTLDLTGLPPTLDEIHDFLADSSPEAYERVVERLLSQPAYGEHMARYWLDLVRFADTNGLHHDHYREMTPYRDWVIRSFHENLPFDQFITYQIAGDLFETPTTDQQIASGFNRLHLIIDVGTALPEESFFRNVVDQVSAVGTAFMGLTLQCAVCHDHKYDPITQQDFYQLSAFFNNFDGEPETGSRGTLDFKRGLQPPYLDLPTPQQAAKRIRLEADIEKLQTSHAALVARRDAAKSELEKLTAVPVEESNSQVQDPASRAAGDSVERVVESIEKTLAEQSLAALEQAVKSIAEQLSAKQKSREELLLEIPATLVMKERAEIRPAHIMIRGAYDQPGAEVSRNTPGFLPPLQTANGVPTRLDLANWLIDPANPLTARVAVNRFWQQLFGIGIVKTSEDFGSQGESPSHPELLDYLALSFVESGWNVKELMRSIVLSQTYQQSSRASRQAYVDDPRNRRLARGSRYRLDAEVVRDQLLSISGLLNQGLYGKSVKPPQPAGLWETVAMPSSYPNSYHPDSGSQIYRRSIYTFWKRAIPPPQMTIFDAPTRESCIARRERTNTPLQALLLMNEEQNFLAARQFAHALLAMTQLTDDQRLSMAYENITSQQPESPTLNELRGGLSRFMELYTRDAAAVDAMLSHNPIDDEAQAIDASTVDAAERVRQAAWTMLVHSLLNLDVTKTRE